MSRCYWHSSNKLESENLTVTFECLVTFWFEGDVSLKCLPTRFNHQTIMKNLPGCLWLGSDFINQIWDISYFLVTDRHLPLGKPCQELSSLLILAKIGFKITWSSSVAYKLQTLLTRLNAYSQHYCLLLCWNFLVLRKKRSYNLFSHSK